MNIIIPMAGLGSRFFSEQYKMPKPLIDIRGKPMIQRAIETLDLDGNYFCLLRQTEYVDRIVDVIKSIVPSVKIKIISHLTEGPACSAMLFQENLNDNDELVIANCDQIMSWNSEMFLHNVRMYDGAVVTYHSSTEKNSFAKLNTKGYVTEIREKEVISNVSLNGIHYWKKSSMFFSSAKEMIESNDRAENGEFYIGPTYNYMIKNNYKVGIYHIPNEQHHPVGVPYDLDKYLRYHDNRQN